MKTGRCLLGAVVLISAWGGQIEKPSPFPSKNKKAVVDAPAPTGQKEKSDPSESSSKNAPSVNAPHTGSVDRDRNGDGNVGTACFYNPKRGGGEGNGADRRASVHEAVHASYEKGTRVKVTNLANNKNVVVTVTGHTELGERIIGVSRDAADELGFVRIGTAQVKLEVVK